MISFGRGHGQGKAPSRDGIEHLGESLGGHHMTWLIDLVTCCFPEPYDQPVAKENTDKDKRSVPGRPLETKRRRKTTLPLSRYNPSVCYQQPPRQSQLSWPAPYPGDLSPISSNMQHQIRAIADDEALIELPKSRFAQYQSQSVEEGGTPTIYSKPRNSRRRSGVIADPNALINRPKSSYSRNLRTTDEEPIFWQHSHRATSRFCQSQLSTRRPTSPPTSGHPKEFRRSYASTFENHLDETFALRTASKLLSPPLINIQPPATPNLPNTPIIDAQPSQARTPPSPTVPNISPRQEFPSRKRFSGFRPLQLSIYLPGHGLPSLPRFSDDKDGESDIPLVPEIPRPPTALMKVKSGLTFNRPLTSHSIPRKPVAARATSMVDGSTRSSIGSNITLTGETHLRGSTMLNRYRSNRRLSKRSTREFQETAEPPSPPFSQVTSHCWTENDTQCSQHRVSVQSLRCETRSEEIQQTELKCHTISEEASPPSPLSPASSKHHASVAYHDYNFVSQSRPDLKNEGPSYQRDSAQLAPSFNAPTSSRDSSDHELLPPSTPRSSSGSSTFYNEGSQQESDLPIIKTTLSVAFPSPFFQHRLSEWLSRSTSPIPAGTPQQGDQHRNADSPTLGFNWNDFGVDARKRISKDERGSQYRRKRTYTDGSLASTYVDGTDNADLEKFLMPVSIDHHLGVGVAI